MSNWMKLGLPIGLGLLAAFINWTTVRAKITPMPFIAVNRDMKQGEKVAPDDLKLVKLSGDLASLPKTAVPWGDQSFLFHRVLVRDMQNGDIVFWRDTESSRDFVVRPNADELPYTIRLPENVSLPYGNMVGQFVLFHVQNQGQNIQGPKPIDILGPYRVLNVGGQKNVELQLALKISPETKLLDAGSQRLLASAQGTSNERIVLVEPHSLLK